MSNIWNEHPELVERLLELNEQALSASQIARALGGVVSRNAVNSKLDRLGVGMKTGTSKESFRTERKRNASPKAPKPAPFKMEVVAPQPLCAPGTIPDGNSCRYIAGEIAARDADGAPAWQMCGHKGYPWCEHHKSICFDTTSTDASRRNAMSASQDAMMRRMGLA